MSRVTPARGLRDIVGAAVVTMLCLQLVPGSPGEPRHWSIGDSLELVVSADSLSVWHRRDFGCVRRFTAALTDRVGDQSVYSVRDADGVVHRVVVERGPRWRTRTIRLDSLPALEARPVRDPCVAAEPSP